MLFSTIKSEEKNSFRKCPAVQGGKVQTVLNSGEHVKSTSSTEANDSDHIQH
jgi:hypothetical protein